MLTVTFCVPSGVSVTVIVTSASLTPASWAAISTSAPTSSKVASVSNSNPTLNAWLSPGWRGEGGDGSGGEGVGAPATTVVAVGAVTPAQA